MSDTRFVFSLHSLIPEPLRPEVSRALECYTAHNSRQAFPRLWDFTDRLNARTKASPATPLRRGLRTALSLFNYLLGLVLFVTALTDIQSLLIPLLVGGGALVIGHTMLWFLTPRLLCILNFFFSVVLIAAAFGHADLFSILPAGIALLMGGIARLLCSHRKKVTRFDKAADQLLQSRSQLSAEKEVRITFTEEGMTISLISPEDPVPDEENGDSVTIPYHEFRLCLETEQLFLPIFSDSILLLQKSELTENQTDAFRAFLSERTTLLSVPADTETF